MIKHYLPEIWFHLIKVKESHFKALSHYYASIALLSNIGKNITRFDS